MDAFVNKQLKPTKKMMTKSTTVMAKIPRSAWTGPAAIQTIWNFNEVLTRQSLVPRMTASNKHLLKIYEILNYREARFGSRFKNGIVTNAKWFDFDPFFIHCEMVRKWNWNLWATFLYSVTLKLLRNLELIQILAQTVRFFNDMIYDRPTLVFFLKITDQNVYLP